MYISNLLDAELLGSHIRNGYVTARRHPHLPLTILNYTPKAQYEQMWDEVTTRCRGLVVDNKGEIAANCMYKFFNYGEPNAKDIDLSGPVQVTDKLDGSMGLVAFYEDILFTATRGSFESEQAQFAYDHIMKTQGYADAFHTICGNSVTAVVEIIYPENRIVVDYGEMRDVVLIGAIANNELSNGRQLWIPADKFYSWPGPRVEKFNAKTFEDALRIPPRINKEGIVVYFESTGDRLKLKQQDYLIAHKFVSNLTPKNVWQQLHDGNTLENLLEMAPDEFHDTVREYVTSIQKSFDHLLKLVNIEFDKINRSLTPGYSRKDFALAVAKNPYRSHLFHVLDQRSDLLVESVWKAIQP